jgi:hypothetical protein
VISFPLVPRIPVTHGESVVGAHLRGILLACFAHLGALLERSRRGEHLHDEEKALAIGERHHCLDVDGERGHLLRFAAVGRDLPDLRRAAARGDEVDPLAVGREARPAIRGGVAREPAHEGAVGGREPHVAARFVRRHVGRCHGEGDELSVRRDVGIVDPVHGQHVVNPERVPAGNGSSRGALCPGGCLHRGDLRRWGRRGARHQEEWQNEESLRHARLIVDGSVVVPDATRNAEAPASARDFRHL